MAEHQPHLPPHRQPRGIPAGGQFAAAARAEARVTLCADPADWNGPDRPDLTTWTPGEVDTELARLYGEIALLDTRRTSEEDFVDREIARYEFNRGFSGTVSRSEREETLARWAEERSNGTLSIRARQTLEHWDRAQRYADQADSLRAQMQPYNEEFERRGGWTRAFLVTNAGGHVHKDMNCSTCFPTTRYHWVTEMSGRDETEIVDAAGERACTVCYPSAPADTLTKPTGLHTPEEQQKAKDRETRTAAKAAREAQRIAKGLTPDGSPFQVTFVQKDAPGHDYDPATGQHVWSRRDRERTETFKTEQAATQWLVSNLVDYRGSRDEPLPDGLAGAHEQILNAIMAKHGQTREQVEAMIEKKVAAKIKRENR